jgi:hypothetical protein
MMIKDKIGPATYGTPQSPHVMPHTKPNPSPTAGSDLAHFVDRWCETRGLNVASAQHSVGWVACGNGPGPANWICIPHLFQAILFQRLQIQKHQKVCNQLLKSKQKEGKKKSIEKKERMHARTKNYASPTSKKKKKKS